MALIRPGGWYFVVTRVNYKNSGSSNLQQSIPVRNDEKSSEDNYVVVEKFKNHQTDRVRNPETANLKKYFDGKSPMKKN